MIDQNTELCKAAIDAAQYAYAPYSKFHVGAALLLNDGQIITAANFENASYGMSLCAETVAIAKANSEGKLDAITDIAVAGGLCSENNISQKSTITIGKNPLTPCGRCRQIIKEASQVSNHDIAVHCVHANGHDTYRISELLPHAFGQENIT